MECPSVPGCVSQGKTIEEALENIKDAIKGCLEVLGERIEKRGNERIMEEIILRNRSRIRSRRCSI